MHKVIFDTDPGVDDAMALLFLQRHPDIELIGITTAFGNASIETTTRNAQYLKQQWGISAPIAKGAAEQYEPGRATQPISTVMTGSAISAFPMSSTFHWTRVRRTSSSSTR
jgi:purine nucleosidase